MAIQFFLFILNRRRQNKKEILIKPTTVEYKNNLPMNYATKKKNIRLQMCFYKEYEGCRYHSCGRGNHMAVKERNSERISTSMCKCMS